MMPPGTAPGSLHFDKLLSIARLGRSITVSVSRRMGGGTQDVQLTASSM